MPLASYLQYLLGLGAYSSLTLISCSIFYLESPITIKTYTQLWNKSAFVPHSSELICTCLSHQNCLLWLSTLSFLLLRLYLCSYIISLVILLVLHHTSSEPHIALKAHSYWLWHWLFVPNRLYISQDQIFSWFLVLSQTVWVYKSIPPTTILSMPSLS